MMCLIRHFTETQIQDKLPLNSDTTKGASISRIKYYRNIIVHTDPACIDDKQFEEIFDSVTKVTAHI